MVFSFLLITSPYRLVILESTARMIPPLKMNPRVMVPLAVVPSGRFIIFRNSSVKEIIYFQISVFQFFFIDNSIYLFRIYKHEYMNNVNDSRTLLQQC